MFQVRHPVECVLGIVYIKVDKGVAVENAENIRCAVPDGYGAGQKCVEYLLGNVTRPVDILHDQTKTIIGEYVGIGGPSFGSIALLPTQDVGAVETNASSPTLATVVYRRNLGKLAKGQLSKRNTIAGYVHQKLFLGVPSPSLGVEYTLLHVRR